MANNTRQKIERATIKLMATRGMDAVSMRDIAANVGVTEAALYRHFSNKHALVWDIFAQNYDAFATRLNNIQAKHDAMQDKLHAMVIACCEFFDRDRDLFSFLLLTQHIQKIAPKNYQSEFSIMMHRLLTDAIKKGEVPWQNVEIATAMVMGSVLQTALYCMYQKPRAGKMMPAVETLSAACWRIIKGA